MNEYWTIALIILSLGCVGSIAWRKHQKNLRETTWLHVFLLMTVLEVEARKARDRQRAKDRAKPE